MTVVRITMVELTELHNDYHGKTYLMNLNFFLMLPLEVIPLSHIIVDLV